MDREWTLANGVRSNNMKTARPKARPFEKAGLPVHCRGKLFRHFTLALSNQSFRVDRHPREGGDPVFNALDSRLRGNDKPLFLALTKH
jgi:hypothetical protein